MNESFAIDDPEPAPEWVSDDNHLFGPGWVAERGPNGCTLSWDGGEIASRDITVTISDGEFERLRANRVEFDEIARRHDPQG